MPTYQYACTECGNRSEAVQSFTDPALVECSACGGRLRKVYSAVGVVFKGSGFYKNDSRAGANRGEGGADKADKADKAEKADKPAAQAGGGADRGSSDKGAGDTSGRGDKPAAGGSKGGGTKTAAASSSSTGGGASAPSASSA